MQSVDELSSKNASLYAMMFVWLRGEGARAYSIEARMRTSLSAFSFSFSESLIIFTCKLHNWEYLFEGVDFAVGNALYFVNDAVRAFACGNGELKVPYRAC